MLGFKTNEGDKFGQVVKFRYLGRDPISAWSRVLVSGRGLGSTLKIGAMVRFQDRWWVGRVSILDGLHLGKGIEVKVGVEMKVGTNFDIVVGF